MASKTSSLLTWLLVVAVVAIVVADNVKMCRADGEPASDPPGTLDKIDMGRVVDKVKDKANEAKDSWTDWFKKISGKENEKLSTGDMKEGAENMMNKAKDSASEATSYVSDKAKKAKDSASETMWSAEGKAEGMYDGAKQKVGEAYDSTKSGMKSMSSKAGDKYEGAKEKASNAAGEVGSKLKGN